MVDALIGKWVLRESNNFDEFLKEMGVGIMWRKLAASSKPICEIKKEGDTWTIKTSTTLKSSEIVFKIGEEFEEKRMDGVTCKTVMNIEDDKLVQTQFGAKEVKIIREVENDELKVTCTILNVVATRIYSKA